LICTTCPACLVKRPVRYPATLAPAGRAGLSPRYSRSTRASLLKIAIAALDVQFYCTSDTHIAILG